MLHSLVFDTERKSEGDKKKFQVYNCSYLIPDHLEESKKSYHIL